ncbi:uncharacterized protein LOC121373293 [Gigantopelta aegis]|uniref:uncharacterized protein LOC121373293 n=1 Tax=Gigantopelta aegis TaxID=1735272 RepID=UPI001B88BC29|nr:uncharacterized protein LOC121373293 [Gigantopelta aegis]
MTRDTRITETRSGRDSSLSNSRRSLIWARLITKDIETKFRSHRTEYGKLKNRLKKRKSGGGKLVLTSLQKWKLRQYTFLDHFLSKQLEEDLGTIQGSEMDDYDDGVDIEDAADKYVAETSAGGPTPYGSVAIGGSGEKQKKLKKSPASSSVAEILSKFLTSSEQEKKKTQKEMDTMAKESQQPMDERVSWRHWLMSTCLRVPSEHFQQYQRDTFEATLR